MIKSDIEKNISALNKMKRGALTTVKFSLETFLKGLEINEYNYSSNDIQTLIQLLLHSSNIIAKYEGAISEYEVVAEIEGIK